MKKVAFTPLHPTALSLQIGNKREKRLKHSENAPAVIGVTGFTLVEVLVALIIIAVLAALSITTFQKTVQTHNEKLCQENLKALQGAIEIYTLENNALPVTLSQLTHEQINLAYSKVAGEAKENNFLVFFKNLLGIKPALAVPTLPARYYGSNIKVLKCPGDTTSAAISYEVNPAITDLGNSDTENQALVADIGLNHKEQNGNHRLYRMAINQVRDLGNIFSLGTFVIDEWVVPPPTGFSPSSVNSSTCCRATRDAWRALPRYFRTACRDAGYRSPDHDGTPRGACHTSGSDDDD